jgi:5-methylcytosine-specific restriction endonuclease McrA
VSKYGYRHEQIRLAVLARDGYSCHWCGGDATTADHLTERARGGGDSIDNYVASCKPCNSRRGAIFGNRLRALRDRHPFFP